MAVYVLGEYAKEQLSQGTLVALSAATKWSSNEIILVLYQEIFQEPGAEIPQEVSNTLILQGKHFLNPLAEDIVKSFTDAVSLKEGDILLTCATTTGKNVLPRFAMFYDVEQVSDVVDIAPDNIVTHPIYAGNALEVVQIQSSIKIVSIRPTAFEPLKVSKKMEVKKIVSTESQGLTKFIAKHDSGAEGKPDLSLADVVLSGGRGCQSKEGFEVIHKVAETLKAAVGASRAAVDLGYISNDCQVGQTGKIIAPKVYIAAGISGAIQHQAGMKDSGIIVAINTDSEAPIFNIATYGLVGDLFEVLPLLAEKLKS